MATTADRTPALDHELESHRRELTGYCYRMLGSGFEAEDAVQETFVRAWRNYDGFEGRSSLRSWLYRIATNVCLDMLQGPQRRARPMDMGPAATADSTLGAPLTESAWVLPIADATALPEDGDPAELAAQREALRLAFVAALQHLPPRQRAVLILREVLRWQASEVAELLGMTVASVNSALQRARATIEQLDLDASGPAELQGDDQELLDRYVDYFERYDIESLVALIADDAEFSMPPFDLWLRGTPDIAKWYVGQGIGCKDSRMIALNANGCPAFAQYKPAGPGRWEPWALQVIEVSDGKITGLHHFLEPAKLFEKFGVPPYLEGNIAYSSERASSSS
jgi:RNA polymerase sigma-70 factor (ECF subfamily)